MKIAIFAILIISMGIMISVSPEAHAIDSGSLEQNMNPPLKNNQDMDDIKNNTDSSKFIDIDNSLFDIYLS